MADIHVAAGGGIPAGTPPRLPTLGGAVIVYGLQGTVIVLGLKGTVRVK